MVYREELDCQKPAFAGVMLVFLLLLGAVWPAAGAERNPYERQVAEQVTKLNAPEAHARAAAAEALGFLRAFAAAEALTRAAGDPAAAVRREAVMALGWCGGRGQVQTLLAALSDDDWVVRQAAAVALENLTGMAFPFDALAAPKAREGQARYWRDWCAAIPADAPPRELKAAIEDDLARLADDVHEDVPYLAQWFPALCRELEDAPRLIELLDHDNHWVRINAAKALMFIDAKSAIEPLGKRLAAAPPEGAYRFSGVLEHAEYDDPAPRWREAFVRALGRLGAVKYGPLLAEILEDDRNVLDVRHAAALALDELGSPAALAERPASTPQAIADGRLPEALIFIKGDNRLRTDFNDQSGLDPWRETYSITNSGPTLRVGRNIYILRPPAPDGAVTALTRFASGCVADCEVSPNGKRVIFARRLNDESRHYTKVEHREPVLRKPGEAVWGGADDPWWHLWEINLDGTGLKQLTFGPHHDVQPEFLPDGRIVFSSTRIGLRDEYHGFPGIGLTVMNADGSDVHCIGFNLGGDREPAIMSDGRIVLPASICFTRA